jgi:ABC-type lipoprotein export system ATPase subunit
MDKNKNYIDNNCEGTTYLFKDLDLEIQPGTTNAIVGYSGFGKTTLLNLMVNLFSYLLYRLELMILRQVMCL